MSGLDQTGGDVSSPMASRGDHGDKLTYIWQMNREQLLQRAAWRLRYHSGVVDPEDIVISAMGSVCRRLKGDANSLETSDEGNLLGLLMRIIDCKAINSWHRERRAKRGGGRLLHLSQELESAMEAAEGRGNNGNEESSLYEAMDALDALLESTDETLQRIVLMRLDGMVLEDIAESLGVSTATVSRKLTRVRHYWECVLRGSCDDGSREPTRR